MHIHQSFDATLLAYSVEDYRKEMVNFDPYSWIENPLNIALTDGEGNYNLLEYEMPGIYTGHTFYKKRGKEALEHLRAAMAEGFNNHPLAVVRGLTPIKLVGARWLARKGGFKSYGVVETTIGPCELFILTKQEYFDEGRQ